MDRIYKARALNGKKADAAADLALINQYSIKELKPEDVYCFSVVLCDNDVDRDNERFTNAALEALAPLFLGKAGIYDHNWSAEKQLARLYRVETVPAGRKNSLGEELLALRGSAYMLRTEKNRDLIAAIEGGILKEVSVGCSVRRRVCSVCGTDSGGCRHTPGQKYGGRLCFMELEEPTDAFEFSFVAVPAQRGAGVTKAAGEAKTAQQAAYRPSAKERLERQLIAEEAKKYLERTDNKMKETFAAPDTEKRFIKPSLTAKAAYYRARFLGNDMASVFRAYEGLGAIPADTADLGYGDKLLPTNLGKELLLEPVEENSLRLIEPVSQIRGLEEPKINFIIDGAALEDVTDKETAREIELTGGSIAYGRFKTKILAVLKDTVFYGSDFDLVTTIESGLRSGLAVKEKTNAFRTVSDGVHDHMSFYLNGLKEVEGPDLIQAIINAWADLPEAFSGNARCVMRKQDYYAAIRTLANGAADLWGKKPEDVVGIPVIFNDYATIPVVGDFRYARQNYDVGAILDKDKDVNAGEYYFVLTAWGDHRIRIKNAFRLAKAATAAG